MKNPCFRTAGSSGDVAVLDEDKTVRLTDRAKDVIKSGGEWMSSIDVEIVLAWLKPRWSAYPIQNGKSGRCSLWCR